MEPTQWQRARSAEQVEQRSQTILAAAEKIFRTQPYEKVTMQRIAREAGLSQSNLYRYFQTREEVFLAIYRADIDLWFRRIRETFSRKLDLEEFVSAWTELLLEQHRMLELSPHLAVTLEKNTSREVYRETKLFLSLRMEEAVPVLLQVLPEFSSDSLRRFLRIHQILVAGAWPMSRYTPWQEEIIRDLGIPQIRVDFPEFYRETVLLYLRGLLQEDRISGS